jgi:hypothetical protein
MDNRSIISSYCIIRNKQVNLNGSLFYSGHEEQPAGFFLELYKHCSMNYPKFHKMDTLCRLGFLASELMLSRKKLNERYRGEDIGLILYNAAASMESDKAHQKSISSRDSYFPSPSVFVYTLANIVIGEICIRNKFFGESTFFIEKKFNPSLIHQYVGDLMARDTVQCCLTGWLEMDGDHYDGVLYLIEKSTPDNHGIVIFEPEKLSQIYLQGT